MKIKRLLLVVAVSLSWAQVNAGDKDLMEHLPLFSFFVLDSRDPSIACGSESTDITEAEINGDFGRRGTAIAGFRKCVQDKAIPRMEISFLKAAKYLKDIGKPNALTALKNYYLKKSVVFEAAIPEIEEKDSDKRARQQRSSALSLDAELFRKEVELEIKL